MWAAISIHGFTGLFFFEEIVNSERYLSMLCNNFIRQLLATALPFSTQWFMEDGARPHTENIVLNFLHEHFDMRVISLSQWLTVHCCGPGGSMRACYTAGLGSIPDQDKFPGWGFFRGVSSPVRQMSGSFRPPRPPTVIWPLSSSSIGNLKFCDSQNREKFKNSRKLWETCF